VNITAKKTYIIVLYMLVAHMLEKNRSPMKVRKYTWNSSRPITYGEACRTPSTGLKAMEAQVVRVLALLYSWCNP
jgi:hypothetical protein